MGSTIIFLAQIYRNGLCKINEKCENYFSNVILVLIYVAPRQV